MNRKRNRGVTLVELMITMAIIGIGVLASVGSFHYITVSIQNSKCRTLANNLSQEQVEKLKNLSYYMLLVTTATQSYPGLSGVDYDIGNYPASTFLEGGISFVRATRVDFAFQNGTIITTAPWTSNDTGLKQISTYVIWTDMNGLQHQEVRNLMANPAANPLTGVITGTVRDNSSNPLAGALIEVVDNPNWYGTSNSAGVYSFNVSQGSYTLTCSSAGFFSATTPSYLSVVSNTSVTRDFTLGRMSSGTAVGYVYLEDHLVISQVVASTGTTGDVEYIELYNPTTSAILIGTNLTVNSPNIVPICWDHSNNPSPHRLLYINTSIPANGYFLISNTYDNVSTCNPFTVMGTAITPDACWKFVMAPSHAIEQADAGGMSIGTSDSVYSGWSGFNPTNWPATRIDSIAWSKNSSGHSAPTNAVEGTGLSNTGGMQPNEQYVRMSAPGSLSSGLGRAYDSDTNHVNFMNFTSLTYPPYKSTNIQSPVSGKPATGAYVALNDPLSQTGTCNSTLLSGVYPVCTFNVPSIATGSWTMNISSGTYYKEFTNVTIVASVSTGVPNGATSPTWTTSGSITTLLNDTTSYAFLSGVVTNAANTPLAGIIVAAGGKTNTTGTSGRYFLSVPAGDIQVVANYNNSNRAYTSQAKPNVGLLATTAGQLYDSTSQTWFTLSLGGVLVGYFQTGSATPIPGRVANALLSGSVMGTGISGSDGHFYIANLTTASYVVQPALDPAEAASPSSTTVTLSSTGTATTVSTFTITSGLSEIYGQVLTSSASIKTGVLVMASTATLSGGSTAPPPIQDGSTAVLCDPCYYAGSSDSSGHYSLNVRSSATAYKLYGWYTTFNGTTPTVTRQGPYTVNVSTAGQLISQNITW